MSTSGLLFGKVYPARFSEAWIAAVKKAGLPAGIRFHSLRHWYGSCQVRAGFNVKIVQARLAHTSATVTLDIYSHLWPGDADLGRGAVTAALQDRARGVHAVAL